MKTIAIILFLAPFWATIGLAQEKNIAELLSNSETRSEIFNSILNDHQLMMDFMAAVKDNDHAMMMMQADSAKMGNSSMGGMNKSGEHQMMGMKSDNSEMMQQMMKENPEMMQKMMGNMMDMCEQDSTMCNNMANMMSEHPHMMQMSMQKMKY